MAHSQTSCKPVEYRRPARRTPKPARIHISGRIRAAHRNGLFEQTEDFKRAHLERVPHHKVPNSTERMVLLELADYAGQNGRINPSVETLATALELGRRTVERALACLRARGILLRQVRGGKWSHEARQFKGTSTYALNVQMIDRLAGYQDVGHSVKLTHEPQDNYVIPSTESNTTVEGKSTARKLDLADMDHDRKRAPVYPPPPRPSNPLESALNGLMRAAKNRPAGRDETTASVVDQQGNVLFKPPRGKRGTWAALPDPFFIDLDTAVELEEKGAIASIDQLERDGLQYRVRFAWMYRGAQAAGVDLNKRKQEV